MKFFFVEMVDKGNDFVEEEDFIIVEDVVVMKYKMVGDMVNCKWKYKVFVGWFFYFFEGIFSEKF